MKTPDAPPTRCPECGRFTFHRSSCSRRDTSLPVVLDRRARVIGHIPPEVK